jgi:hypothetical protein
MQPRPPRVHVTGAQWVADVRQFREVKFVFRFSGCYRRKTFRADRIEAAICVMPMRKEWVCQVSHRAVPAFPPKCSRRSQCGRRPNVRRYKPQCRDRRIHLAGPYRSHSLNRQQNKRPAISLTPSGPADSLSNPGTIPAQVRWLDSQAPAPPRALVFATRDTLAAKCGKIVKLFAPLRKCMYHRRPLLIQHEKHWFTTR